MLIIKTNNYHNSEVEGQTGKSCSVFVSCVTCVRSCARVIPCAWPLRRTRVLLLLLLLGWAPVVSRGVSWCLVSHGVSWCLVSRGVSCLMVSRVSWCLVGPGAVSWCLNLPQPPYHPQGGRTGISLQATYTIRLEIYKPASKRCNTRQSKRL